MLTKRFHLIGLTSRKTLIES